MVLDYLPLPDGTARLVRVYGNEPCITLPQSVPETDRERPITELGDYCFSESPRELKPAVAACLRRWPDGASGDALHPVCGNFLEEAVLPDRLCVVGSCAFYNCRKLRRLSFGAQSLAVGSDVFLNCFALRTLELRAAPEDATGAFALVNNISEAVRAVFWPDATEKPLAAFWYPAYWEDIEETPAHILLHTFSGQGYHYRQCFRDGALLPKEYDAIFPQGHDEEDAEVMVQLCFDRLRWPWRLDEAARTAYRGFLTANAARILKALLRQEDEAAVRALIALDVLDAEALAQGVEFAARTDNAAAAVLLADAERQKRAAFTPKKRNYDFDF